MSNNYNDPDSQQLRFIILTQDAGGIIGKSGAHIRQVRDESNCHVNISGNTGTERILNVKGKPGEINDALKMITQKLKEMSSGGEDGKPRNSRGYDAPVTMRLLVPQQQCGSIIGTKGANVKKMREESGATITIPSGTLVGSTERAVTVSGEPDAIARACEMICDKFLEFPVRHSDVYQYIPNGMPGGMPGNPFTMMGGGQRYMGGMARHTEQKLTLPSNVIGSLIGKGGCHINEIRQFSGATVSVEENKRDDRKSDVIVGGSSEAVSCATFLINARINAGRQQQQNRNRREGGDQNRREGGDQNRRQNRQDDE